MKNFFHFSFNQDEWKWDMETVFDYKVPLSSLLVGKWRSTIQWELKTKEKTEFMCIRFFGDIVEM